MSVHGDYNIDFQSFRTSEAKNLTPSQLDSLEEILGPLIQDLANQLGSIAADMKNILNNPNLNKDEIGAEVIHMEQTIQKTLDDFVNKAKDAINKSMPHLDEPGLMEKIDSFITDLCNQAQNKTGVAELLDKLKQRGKTSIFTLTASQTTGLGAAQGLGATQYSHGPPSDPLDHPLIDPTTNFNYSVGGLRGSDVALGLADLKNRNAFSPGGTQLINELIDVLSNSNLYRDSFSALKGVINPLWNSSDPQARDQGLQQVYMRFPGLSENEFLSICQTLDVNGTISDFASVQSTYIEKKLADLGTMYLNSTNPQDRQTLQKFMQMISQLKLDASPADLQRVGREFSEQYFNQLSPDMINQISTFAGIYTSPLFSFFEDIQEKMQADGLGDKQDITLLIDRFKWAAEDQGLDKKTSFKVPDDFISFMNSTINSLQNNTDIYVYGATSPEILQWINQNFCDNKLSIPPKTDMDDVIRGFNSIGTGDQALWNFTLYDLKDLLSQLGSGANPAEGAANLKKLHQALSDYYFNRNPLFMTLSKEDQIKVFNLAHYSYTDMFADKFSTYLNQYPNMSGFVEDFLQNITPGMNPDEAHNALANFLTNASGDWADIFMRYPTITQEGLLGLNTLFNTQFPMPNPSPVDIISQKVYQMQMHNVTNSDDYVVLADIRLEIMQVGSLGSTLDIHNWAQNYLHNEVANRFTNISQPVRDLLNSL